LRSGMGLASYAARQFTEDEFRVDWS
jgi:hypothetical protein